jgi:diguanylate cyclase (GGDEF)-like protein
MGVWAFVVVGTLIVGWIDYTTSADVSVLALYFLPLLVAGRYFGRLGATFAAGFALIVWLSALHFGGESFSSFAVWVVNALTAGASFLIVALLVSLLGESINRERALGRRDPLTGLANRLAFFEVVTLGVSIASRHDRPVSVAYLDLDRFKQVNDRHGHQRGDELLRTCADVLLRSVRAGDTVARLGGDEFALFLPETTEDEAARLIGRIRQAIDLTPDFAALDVDVSFGVVSEHPVRSDATALIAAADARMYEAKKRDRSPAGTK